MNRQFKGNSVNDFPQNYVVIDIETTGLDPSCDKIIEVAAIKYSNFEEVDSYSSLINPSMEISPFISHLTGISNEMLATAPDELSVLQHLFAFIGESIVIGHNVHFDINFLYDNFEKYLHEPFENNFVDTLRLSKKYFKQAPSYKLTALADYLNISVDISHRALEDCYTANCLYKKLVECSKQPIETETQLLESLNFDESNPFYQKRIAVKGDPQLYSYTFMQNVAKKCQANLSDVFYSSCDYIIFSKYTYMRYIRGESSEKFEKANKLKAAGSLSILSEEQWYDMLGIPFVRRNKPHHASISAKDIITDNVDFDETHPLFNKLCVFTGTLEKMQRKDAMQIVVDLGGQVGNSVTKKTNYLILGNNDYCTTIKDGKSTKQKKAEELKLSGNDIEIISEDVFYDMISED